MDIEDEVVHQGLSIFGGEIGPENGPLDSVGRALGVCTHCTGLDGLILSVQNDLFPSRVWCVENVVAADHEHAVIVELLHLLDCSKSIWTLPVMLVDPGLTDAEERRVECVTELERSGNSLLEFRIRYSSI